MSSYRYVKTEDQYTQLRLEKVGNVHVVELRAEVGKVYRLDSGLLVADPSRGAPRSADTIGEAAQILARMYADGWS